MSGFNQGTPVVYNGKVGGTEGQATTTETRHKVVNPISKRPSFTREFSIRNLDAGTNLLVRLNTQSGTSLPVRGGGGGLDAQQFTLQPGESYSTKAYIWDFSVESAAGSIDWEATASVA